MTWDFHNYYNNSSDGLVAKLKLSDAQHSGLKELRKTVRVRIRDVFDEAKAVVKTTFVMSLSVFEIRQRLANTRFRYLTPASLQKVAELISSMDENQRKAFQKLSPRFWTQGSFAYDTLNLPYTTPPQEMDIDDGTYLPMEIFNDQPAIGHSLLILLVDTALESLVAENKGWQFEAKNTCGRIRIPSMYVHIDVPMYAVPEDKFMINEAALKAIHFNSDMYQDALFSEARAKRDYNLDPKSVHLAIRDGVEAWRKSDPKIVENWFNDACIRIGPHLRKICRIIKGWRDAQWPEKGPSSISLMAAIVDILDKHPTKGNDLNHALKVVTNHLPQKFLAGIESPDNTDKDLLFPSQVNHGPREEEIVAKLLDLRSVLSTAESAHSNTYALIVINQAFGQRVTKHELIVKKEAAPAFLHEPRKDPAPATISSTLRSG
ncbi:MULTISPECIES: CBASS cGAMP synthase [Gammaproteobacteria]|uniref:CBASS cGAMP synthase n=1 Tax=Gammaproteobacteria TaxID=1236 RepID=UPI001BD50D06|nr:MULTISPECIES: hypothetical protein [Gammaproteobacteria]MCT8127546.1 hypothetical protein [Alishewanella sp. BS5-314]